MTRRKLTVVTFADQVGDYVYHVEVDQSVLDAGLEGLTPHVDFVEEFEWITAVFDGHIDPLPGFGTVLQRGLRSDPTPRGEDTR